MNRLFLILALLFIFNMPQAWAQTITKYPNPYRQTMWNNITDGIHTFGQNTQQTKVTLMKLHSARYRARVHSIYLANQAKRQAWVNSNQ